MAQARAATLDRTVRVSPGTRSAAIGERVADAAVVHLQRAGMAINGPQSHHARAVLRPGADRSSRLATMLGSVPAATIDVGSETGSTLTPLEAPPTYLAEPQAMRICQTFDAS